MKARQWIGIGILVSLGLVMLGVLGGWFLWGRNFWRMPVMAAQYDASASTSSYFACEGPGWGMGRGRMHGGWQREPCDEVGYGGPGMMGSGYAPEGRVGVSEGACPGFENVAPEAPIEAPLSLDDAHAAIEHYLVDRGYSDNLTVIEVMEFEYNFYAIVRETETNIGAMELLVDKLSGVVVPEMGPNMMWNVKYGMHRGRMMGARSSEENRLSEAEALELAQEWLDIHQPGFSVADHAEPFYGYFTIHTLKDSEIEGMLSVHGSTGQVWYHTWHGEFLQMIEVEHEHSPSEH